MPLDKGWRRIRRSPRTWTRAVLEKFLARGSSGIIILNGAIVYNFQEARYNDRPEYRMFGAIVGNNKRD